MNKVAEYKNTIVGANAVVLKNILENAVSAAVPAIVLSLKIEYMK